MKKIVLVTLCLFSLAFGQNQFWKPVDESHLIGDAQISTNHASYFELELSNLKNFLRTAPLKNNNQDLSTVQIQLPLPDGGTDNFMVFEAPIMEKGLANKFPNIKTFIFQSTSNQLRYGRADITLKGFHLMLFDEESTIFIDPFSKNNTDIYQVYFKKDCINNKPMPDCLSQEEASTEKLDDSMLKNNQTLNQLKSVKDSNGQTLRTYRIAVSATAEFTQFHGGTVAEGLSAVVTSINRVNGVYEREFTIRLVLVADNDQIIYTDENTDPFTNPNNAGALLGQNQNSVDNIIGSNNYDIGHVVGRSGSGLASYAVVCRNSKASATTGINNPTGDPFDIDYLAHEIGHQFAGSHTFNSNSGSCSGGNLSSNSAYEPGSATTIMGYAGICAPQNIQNNSDDYFHTRSFDQVLAYTTQFQGDNCPVKTNTGNNIPTIQILSPINKTIPKSTPFELQALANDIDGNAITYCWEQFDLGPTGDPNNPSGNAPLFRSFQPTPNPIRTFPQISDILDNDQTLGEILPDYGRDMSFRVTVRDNVPGGGAVNYDDYEVSVSNTAGPFVVNNPNTNITWTAGTNYDVEWNVANTNQNPVSCNTVNILLSTDGGYTFPITLLSNVPNNGLASVNAPFAFSNQARVRVEAADNIFFDISDENFEIESNCSLIDDPSINIDGPLNGATWCINTSGELYFSVSSPDLIITSYQWFFNGIAIPGATDSILAINNVQTSDGGNYDCTVSNGCSTVFSNTATVFVTSTLILPVITQVANQLQSSIATNIQWYLNGILLPGETNQYIDINASGSYSVSSVSGPCSANSTPYQITGFKDFNKVASISILPNPSQGNFRIQTTGWNKSIELEVLNLLGQTILGNMDFEKAFNLDLSELSDGVYIVSLRSDAYQSSHKLIKK
ncbi:MAG: M12 family metallo-peptidase [Chitinophagales bacterium]